MRMMGVTQAALRLIKDNLNLIEENNFNKLYEIADNEMTDCSPITAVLWEAGIDPLPYMDRLPADYMRRNENISYFTVPGNCKSIRIGSLEECQKLKKIDIKEGVKEIFYGAIYNNPELEEIILPKSIEGLNRYCIDSCPKLNNIFYNGTIKEWEDNVYVSEQAFYEVGDSNIIKIKCKDGVKEIAIEE